MGKNTETLTEIERRVAAVIETDVGDGADPFSEIARRAGVDESTVLDIIKDLRERGVLRRFGAVIRHRRAGFTDNALVVWAVPEEAIEGAGRLLAGRPEVSHCYERKNPFLGHYNLFTMVHGQAGSLGDIVAGLSAETGVQEFLVLESLEEFKKESMRYFEI
ncbi:MAG TPA: Lrp/AsnC family transcriptional regulator [Deltaproteobacteria bacterium]|nr:Lrp/AsnC family transcriptional regulator [Deltaproteobacteria bacterium]